MIFHLLVPKLCLPLVTCVHGPFTGLILRLQPHSLFAVARDSKMRHRGLTCAGVQSLATLCLGPHALRPSHVVTMQSILALEAILVSLNLQIAVLHHDGIQICI